MATKQDKELEQYRKLMEPPEIFEDGFNWRTVVGALFLGFIMIPGSLYMRLLVGPTGGMDQAARWVTIILFAEVARRSFKELKMQEVYVLFFMTGLAMSYAFEGLLWNQYFVQSEYARGMGIAQDIPSWVAPSAEQILRDGRTFFTSAWVVPILFSVFVMLTAKLDHYSLSYVMYRIANDVEKLPFPMAPVAASGITALVDSGDSKQPWRWRCFSIGGVLGMGYGLIYIGIPAITGAILNEPIHLIPIPWVDFTSSTAGFLPAVPFNITFDIGLLLTGMVIPFWAVVGGFIGVVLTMIANPILHHAGILSNWQPQMDLIDTIFSNQVDFYLAFGVGVTIAVVLFSFAPLAVLLFNNLPFFSKPRDRAGRMGAGSRLAWFWRRLVTNNVQRGDFSIFIAIGLYVLSSVVWIGFSTIMIPGFPWHIFIVYSGLYIPVIAYANAKLTGLVGQTVTVPLVREVAYILSGYRGVLIWFAPVPALMYGQTIVEFRIMELTGTKIISQIKTMLVALPIVVVAVTLFSQLFWSMAEIPSDAYPFAQKMWDLTAKNTCLMMSATQEGGSLFMEAWDWNYFGCGLGGALIALILLSLFGLPTLLVYGMVRGLGVAMPATMFLELTGALIGRYYFRKKFGDMWMKYAPVILAGYACGMGLIAMASVAMTVLTKMMTPMVY